MKCAAPFFAFVLTITAWAQIPPPTPIPLDFFGIHMNVGPTGFTTTVLPPMVIGSGGKGTVTNWPYLETARGTYNWRALDAVAAFNQTTGKPVFEGYQEQPRWAVSDTTACYAIALGIQSCPAPPSDLFTTAACQGSLAGTTTTDCMLKEYITSMVNRYKHTGIQDGCTASNPRCHGMIEMYEAWNEPPYSAGPVSGCAAGSSCLAIASFLRIASDWYYTIKALDPQAKVCSPAFEPDGGGGGASAFVGSFLSNGGTGIPFDCWDFHTNAPTPEGQIGNINLFKNYLNQNGINPSTATLYATEAGRWGGCSTSIAATDEQAYIGRIELLYWSNNVKRHYWYAYSECAPLSNQPSNQTLTLIGIGYGNVESWMVGSTMTSPCALSGSFWTCGLTLANGQQALAVWYSVFRSAATANYTPASQYTQWHDLNGNTGAISGAMAIGESPILLEAGGGVQMQDFTIAANPLTVTVTGPGQSGTTTLTVTPINGFNQSLSYSCSRLPSEATCSFTAASSTTETLTIVTTLPSAKLQDRLGQSGGLFYAMLVPGLFGLLVLPAGSRKRSLHAVRLLTFVAILACSMLWMAACGGGSSSPSTLNNPSAPSNPTNPSNPGTPTGSFSVVVTATTGGTNPLSNTVTIPLTVQ
jgi:hypothetical protein